MTRDEARILISSLIEWYTEDLGERLGMSMGKDEYMDALDTLWRGPDGELISRADAMGAVQDHFNADGFKGYDDGQKMMDRLKALPSAETPTTDEKHQLSSETPTNAPTDLISRADAIDAVTDIQDGSGQRYYLAVSLVDKIRSLPSAEAVSRKAKCCPIAETCMSIDCPVSSEYIGRPSAEAVQGEWIHDGQNFKGGIDWCHCSECGYKTSTNGLSVYRFCPNCGERMKGGGSE